MDILVSLALIGTCLHPVALRRGAFLTQQRSVHTDLSETRITHKPSTRGRLSNCTDGVHEHAALEAELIEGDTTQR